ncbi:16S rRNA (uracil(1498)-N(3))-methyltransferase, partial [Acinetobacter baumannii]
EEEEDLACAQGALMLSMGSRVLRTETAGLAALAALNAVWGELCRKLHSGNFPAACLIPVQATTTDVQVRRTPPHFVSLTKLFICP